VDGLESNKQNPFAAAQIASGVIVAITGKSRNLAITVAPRAFDSNCIAMLA
jgi:hypothetical protein